MAITFDSLKFVETLEKANITREQATAFAKALQETHEIQEIDNLVTKRDLQDLATRTETKFELLGKDITTIHNELRKDIDILRKEVSDMDQRLNSKIDTKIDAVRKDLIIWLGGAMILCSSVLSGLLIHGISLLNRLS